MAIKVFIIIAAIFGIGWSLIKSDLKSKLITIGLGLSIAFALCSLPCIKTIGIILYIVLSILVIIFSITRKDLNKSDRLIIILIILPIVVYWTFAFNHYPGAHLLKFLLIIPVFSFIACLIKGKKFNNEFGYLVIYIADTLTVFLPFIVRMILT